MAEATTAVETPEPRAAVAEPETLTRTECAQSGCTEDAASRGRCERHYRKRIRMGIYGYRNAEPARRHVLALRDLGWTYMQIEQACGVSARQARAVENGEYRRVRCDTASRLLSVPLARVASHRGVSPAGAVRRLQALQWMGWPAGEIAARVGSTERTISTVKSRGGLSYALALSIADLYERISHVPGPSKVAAAKARGRGYAPPAAWDDDTIDSPGARPRGVRRG